MKVYSGYKNKGFILGVLPPKQNKILGILSLEAQGGKSKLSMGTYFNVKER